MIVSQEGKTLNPIRPVMLIVMDGWGLRTKEHGNAVVAAKTPNYDRYTKQVERSIIETSGEFVGLTSGQMGNSEVGHQNLGAGRVVYQDITLIDKEIEDGHFQKHPKLIPLLERLKQQGGDLHLVGMVSDGGVHSHLRHLFTLLEVCATHGINPLIHAILDGRDTAPKSAPGFLEQLQAKMDELNTGRIATVAGRHFGMDRDQRWDRTAKFYNTVVYRQGTSHASALGAIEQGYDDDLYDELIEPTVIGSGLPAVKSGDVVLLFNFRSDRMRQITKALAGAKFEGAEHFKKVEGLTVVTMTEYETDLPVTVLYGQDPLEGTLTEVVSNAGLKQYHTAETEKYPHVTFFFNGRREKIWPGEERAMIASPKVKTYDLKPEMSAYELTDATLKRLASHEDDFMLINFANPDLVGHRQFGSCHSCL